MRLPAGQDACVLIPAEPLAVCALSRHCSAGAELVQLRERHDAVLRGREPGDRTFQRGVWRKTGPMFPFSAERLHGRDDAGEGVANQHRFATNGA